MSHPSAIENEEIDLYAVLKIDKSATFDTIQRSFKRLSRTFHPDKRRSPDDKSNAETFFVAIKLAHEILSDPVLRLAYDHGGLVAVDIVRRSHLSASQQQNDEDDGIKTTRQKEHGSEEIEKQDWYQKLQNTKSKDKAIQLIQELVEGYHVHKSLRQKAPIGVEAELVHMYDPQTNDLLSRGLGSLNVQAQRSFFLSKQMELSVTGVAQVQRKTQQGQPQGFASARTTNLGLSYRADGASHHHLNLALNQTNHKHSQFSIQSTRRFVAGNMFTVGLGGGVMSAPTAWVYSLTTNRILMLGSLAPSLRQSDRQRIKPTTKVHMSWSLGTTLLGEIRSIAGTIRNLTFPQFKFRLGLLDSPPIKFTADSAVDEAWHAALSLDWNWWRLKVTKETALWGSDGNWTLRYGLKYDVRGAKLGRAWSVLLHLQSSDDWHLRVPILIRQSQIDAWEWPVTSTLVGLLCQWVLESLWERKTFPSWIYQNQDKHNTIRSISTPTSSSWPGGEIDCSSPYIVEMVSRVAAKKRLYESKRDGLVLIKAIWYPVVNEVQAHSRRAGEGEDMTDVLQFWVLDSRLYLPIQQSRWWSSSSSFAMKPNGDSFIQDDFHDKDRTWAWNWIRFRPTNNNNGTTTSRGSNNNPSSTSFVVGTNSNKMKNDMEDAGALYVRYQMQGFVYEISFQGDELVWLPNTRASFMGVVGEVE